MSSMVPNKVLEIAKKDPSVLTPEEIKAMVQEIMYNRTFITEKLAKYNFSVELSTMIESGGTFYWVVLKNAHGETITPYRTPSKKMRSIRSMYIKSFLEKELYDPMAYNPTN